MRPRLRNRMRAGIKASLLGKSECNMRRMPPNRPRRRKWMFRKSSDPRKLGRHDVLRSSAQVGALLRLQSRLAPDRRAAILAPGTVAAAFRGPPLGPRMHLPSGRLSPSLKFPQCHSYRTDRSANRRQQPAQNSHNQRKQNPHQQQAIRNLEREGDVRKRLKIHGAGGPAI